MGDTVKSETHAQVTPVCWISASPILMQFPESYAYEMPATQLTI